MKTTARVALAFCACLLFALHAAAQVLTTTTTLPMPALVSDPTLGNSVTDPGSNTTYMAPQGTTNHHGAMLAVNNNTQAVTVAYLTDILPFTYPAIHQLSLSSDLHELYVTATDYGITATTTFVAVFDTTSGGFVLKGYASLPGNSEPGLVVSNNTTHTLYIGGYDFAADTAVVSVVSYTPCTATNCTGYDPYTALTTVQVAYPAAPAV